MKRSKQSILSRAFIQFSLLVVVVLWIGYCMRIDESESDTKAVIEHPAQLAITGNAVNEYPDMKFGSDTRWEEYHTDSKKYSECPRFVGQGTIDKSDIDLIFFLTPEGQLMGRYHNHNGIGLDLNGYIEEATGDLKIHLGHDSERSQWVMSPIEEESTDTEFVYEGKWGKKGKPSKVTFILYNEEND